MSGPGPKLASLGGRPCPAPVLEALRALEVMPDEARRVLWRLLGPALAEPPPPSLGELGERFATEHELNPERLSQVVTACRELLRAAVALGVDAEGLGRDLDAVLGQGSAARAVLLAGFAGAERHLRRELARRAIELHGQRLAEAEWRVDQVAATSFSGALPAPVLTLTLGLTGARGPERLTFSVLPDEAQALAQILLKIVPKGEPEGRARGEP